MTDDLKKAMKQTMIEKSFLDLSYGIPDPIDKEVLSYTPLPDSMIGSFLSQDVDALQTMNLTNNALNAWIAEAQKANYFSSHFVTLSRMIMNGVATMARGLVTLHMKGEDLDQAPMSIQDLIGISSYQFRKSYLGVLQTVKSRPEISERLMMNQLRWSNTLIKLFKTRDKLAVPAVIGKDSAGSNQVTGDTDNASAQIPGAAGFQTVGKSKCRQQNGGIEPFSALSAPGSFGAIQAYSSLPVNKTSASQASALSDTEVPGCGSPDLEEKMLHGSDVMDQTAAAEQVAPETEGPRESGNARENGEAAHSDQAKSEALSAARSFHNSMSVEKNEISYSQKTADPSLPPEPDHPPDHVRLLSRVMDRSSGNEDGALEFTLDEIFQLLADPVFCDCEPSLAADLRKYLDTACT